MSINYDNELIGLQKESKEDVLPNKIIRLAHVPWQPCWIQQLKTHFPKWGTL